MGGFQFCLGALLFWLGSFEHHSLPTILYGSTWYVNGMIMGRPPPIQWTHNELPPNLSINSKHLGGTEKGDTRRIYFVNYEIWERINLHLQCQALGLRALVREKMTPKRIKVTSSDAIPSRNHQRVEYHRDYPSSRDRMREWLPHTQRLWREKIMIIRWWAD